MAIIGSIILWGSVVIGGYLGFKGLGWFWIFILGISSAIGWFLFRHNHVIANLKRRGPTFFWKQVPRIYSGHCILVAIGFGVGYLFS